MQDIEIGWFLNQPFGSFAFPQPKAVIATRNKALSNRAVQACPAVNELERRLFEVRCPYNISLEIEKKGGDFELYVVESDTRLDDDLIIKYVNLMPQKIWRDKKAPVIQISSPYVFICDETCYMTQMPPYFDEKAKSWPGVLIAGRFDIKNWLRPLNWAFEWRDTEKPLKLKKNDPLYYLLFESSRPEAKIDLFQAEVTPEVMEFKKGAEGMPKFTSNTFKAMETAAERRPKKLVKRAGVGN